MSSFCSSSKLTTLHSWKRLSGSVCQQFLMILASPSVSIISSKFYDCGTLECKSDAMFAVFMVKMRGRASSLTTNSIAYFTSPSKGTFS